MYIDNIARNNRKTIAVISFFIVIEYAIAQSIPYCIKILSDSIVNVDLTGLAGICVLLVIAGVVKFASTLAADIYYWKFTNSLGMQLLNEFLGKVLDASKSDLSRSDPDSLLRIATSDIDRLKQSLVKQYFVSVSTCVSLAILLFFVVLLDIKLAFITIAWYALFYFVSRKFIDRISQQRITERMKYSSVVSFAKDAIFGASEFKYFSHKDEFFKNIDEKLETYNDANSKVMISHSLSQYIAIIGNFTTIAIILLYKHLLATDISTGSLFAMYMYTVKYSDIFDSILFLRTLRKDNESYKKPIVDFMLNGTESCRNQNECIASIESIAAAKLSVSFNDCIRAFSHVFKKGCTYIICGKSGVGKSTLANALAREIPCTPASLFYNGRPAELVCQKSLNERIAVLNQNPYLINGSIEENMRMFHSEYDRQDVEEIACFLDLPDIYAPIGVSEIEKVSGGERKRIAFARLFLCLQHKDLVILDETFANLDRELISKIARRIKELCAEKILVVVTHDDFVKQQFESACIIELN